MDATNTPNPANSNAQDQFIDAVQVPTNQVHNPQYKIRLRVLQLRTQFKVLQIKIKHRPLQVKFPLKSLLFKFQFKVPNRLVKIYQFSHHHKQVPVQLAPAAIVAPAPQIIYQNWIGKKPQFSGKPEEDVESHLLRTRDWMEAPNFPEGDKVRCFLLMLICEARLWHESLSPLDDDWPTLQNKFRWKYSKIGNTPKQLFHAWRTFNCDENTDMIDSYILRMSQGAANADFREF